MPDWSTWVRERLGSLHLPRGTEDEIVRELAAHLEDLYEEQIARGMNESEASERALDRATWGGLAKNIERIKRKEEVMNNRTRHLWLPGLASLIAASVLLLLEIRLGIRDSFVHLPLAVTAIFPWLGNMLLCGGVAAYLSRRGGGTRLARLSSALFPAGVFFVCFCLVFVARLFEADPFITLSAFAITACNWVLFPGLALLAGAWPFLGARPMSEPESC
jgi:hypothetical protein